MPETFVGENTGASDLREGGWAGPQHPWGSRVALPQLGKGELLGVTSQVHGQIADGQQGHPCTGNATMLDESIPNTSSLFRS